MANVHLHSLTKLKGWGHKGVMDREVMTYDVVIIGGGPAGLSAAIRLKQLALETKREVSVCLVEKGSEVGAHILSGAVIDIRALSELIPDWSNREAPVGLPVQKTEHWWLGSKYKISFPEAMLPPLMSNRTTYTLSLGNFCRWLAKQANTMGVEIYPGFAASEILYNNNGAVCGIAIGDMGLNKEGQPKKNYMRGPAILGKYTLFAEGARGSLTQNLIEKFRLAQDCEPQTYALGLKELWQIPQALHKAGTVIHTQGWPLDNATAGGGFIYHQENNQLALGFVVALDYANPSLSPFDEFQRFKTHPAVRPLLEGAKRVAYGARVINEGGWQSVPKLIFPGGALVGCAAGFVNVPRIKGTHNAMKTGMIAAEAVHGALVAGRCHDMLGAYVDSYKRSWVWTDLYKVRNARPALRKFGNFFGTLYAGIDLWLNSVGLGFLVPWTFGHHADHLATGQTKDFPRLKYAKSDGLVMFDRLSSVYLSNTNHEEDQPCHLKLKNAETPIAINLKNYGSPEEIYCPAAVYEILYPSDAQKPYLRINAQNCIHCKTCDVKDMTQNIVWTPPEGGGGPNYPNM